MKNILHEVRIGGVALWAGLFGMLAFSTAFADMGAIHVSAQGVNVSEPAQKAVVLYNGSEEVLILETDIKASRKTGVLRFLPMPSEPAVELAPEGALQKASELVQSKDLKILSIFRTKGGGPSGREAPVVETVSHRKLGAHDLTIIKINDANHFKKWVRDYFKKKRLGNPGEKAVIDEMVRDYVKRGIAWFAFDFVKVDASDTSVAPLAYRFKTPKIYYPLKTSNSVGGQGKVQLVLAAPNAVGSPLLSAETNSRALIDPSQPVKFDRFQLSTFAAVTPEEISGVYPGAREFFVDMPVVVQCASYSGVLSFGEDLHARILDHFSPDQEQISTGEPAGAESEDDSSLETLLQKGSKQWLRRNTAIDRAEMADRQKQSLLSSILEGSLFVASAGRSVKLEDGVWEEGGMRVEVRMAALGRLDDDPLPDAAVLVEVVKDGSAVCELSVLKGRDQGGRLVVDGPQGTHAIRLDRTDVRDMSVSKRKIHVKPKGDVAADYEIGGDGVLHAVK